MSGIGSMWDPSAASWWIDLISSGPYPEGVNIRLCHHWPISLHTFHHCSLPAINRRKWDTVTPTLQDTQTRSQGHMKLQKNTQEFGCMCTLALLFNCSRIKTCTQTHACIYTITFSQREINPGWSERQRCFHMRKFWFWNQSIQLVLASNCNYTLYIPTH